MLRVLALTLIATAVCFIIPETAHKKENMFEKSCRLYGNGNATIREIERGSSFFPFYYLRSGAEELYRNSSKKDVAEALATLCSVLPAYKTFRGKTNILVSKCIEGKNKALFYNVARYDSLMLDYVCNKNATVFKDIVLNGGVDCIKKHVDSWGKNCLNQTEHVLQNQTVFSDIFKDSKLICKTKNELKNCTMKTIAQCSNKFITKHVEGLFASIKIPNCK